MTAREVVATRLRTAGCVFAEEEADLLLDAATDAAALEALVSRRAAGEPLEYILGWAEFCGLRIHVEPGVFVPRLRTAFLVDLATTLVAGRRHPLVVDLCCGTGAIAAALAVRLDDPEVFAADIDPAAVRCARGNLGTGGVVALGDSFAALPAGLRGRVDLLAVNAPYVPTAEIATMPTEARSHEALRSLDGGRDGLDVQRRVAADAPRWLRAGGHLLIETSERQADRTAAIVADAGLSSRIEHSEDLDATVVVGTRSRVSGASATVATARPAAASRCLPAPRSPGTGSGRASS